MPLRIGSLFSGYGGLDLALTQVLNATLAWHSEIEPAPVKVLAHHYPHTPNLGDITTITNPPPVDIITGGSPCQDISTAGMMAGMRAGTRSNLWQEMLRIITHTKPQLILWENVKGAHNAPAASRSDMEPHHRQVGIQPNITLRATGRVCGDLAGIGYDTSWTTLPASLVGAPHRRDRIFLIAWPATTHPRSLRQHRRGTTPRQARRAHATTHRRRTGPVDHWDAINHWAALTRPAPEPTLIGKRGGEQLNPGFAEWMMGLPEGWVTSVPGISRAEQLRMLGNGVVPQQAAFALNLLLNDQGD